ncbi:hypothetical protein MMC08_007237 [Hypocenomyce scalaris]|nr:hypothetical protein [Hypocenomyce scalaris]
MQAHEVINSSHLWLCTQPPECNWETAASYWTPFQNEKREELAQMAYLGWRSRTASFWTLDRNLPLLEPSFSFIAKKGRRTIFMPNIKNSNADLGTLDQLPLEILSHIISPLDISTLDRLKAVNRRSFEVTNAHPQFNFINRQAHDALRGVRAIKTSHAITLQALFEKLCTSQCDECGDYGGYLYLVTFRRVCYRCFTEKDRYWPLREIDAVRNFGLSLDILRTVRSFLRYPGRCGDERDQWDFRDYTSLMDRESAFEAGIACHGSLEAMQAYVANADPHIWRSCEQEIKHCEKKLAAKGDLKKRERKARQKAAANKRNADKREVWARIEERERRVKAKAERLTSAGHPGIQREDGDTLDEKSDIESVSTLIDTDAEEDVDSLEVGAVNSPEQSEAESTSSEDSGAHGEIMRGNNWALRYMAILRVPWLNRQSRRDEWGFHCVGCEDLHQRIVLHH